MHRPAAPRLARLLACAAVPVMLITGCSSGSGSSPNGQQGQSGSPSTASATSSSLAAAKYKAIPDPCKAMSPDTVNHLVQSAKDPNGSAAKSTDSKTRGGCSWNGLDGYQFRYLDDSFQRFDSIPTASAEDQAKTSYQQAVTSTTGKASSPKATQLSGLGDGATLVTWDDKKGDDAYHNATVVARSANVVVVVDFNGAGMQGDDKPKADEMDKDTQQAAKEALASLK
ncbi:DUF3558 domain-containing protein [Streptantibioticus ferralitis]|uniref:DUF3558 domain-containing protein n=1 Tax=Streptantibioticus ferralitis TaxID=236510 RepID=A0ABT5Z7J7_9ACTN|nr:DUF3558 domain-containing protein [Streptantibioticus ferralitis]MDF2259808.1 DUF3558 domain-containing protein [Streptantibioticus ferralitis]